MNRFLCPKQFNLLWVFIFLLTLLFLSLSSATYAAFTNSASSNDFALSDEEQHWLQQHETIRVGVMEAWPPLDFVDQHNRATGIGVDYIKLLNKRLNGILKIVPGDWKTLYDEVKTGQLDALMDFTPKPERRADFNVTTPYLSIPHAIVAPKQSDYLYSEESLKGKSIALEKGFGNVDYFRSNYPSISISEYDNTELALDAVARGEADAYAGNRSVALYIMGQEIMTTLKVHGRLKKEGSILAIGIRKDWPLLTQILNRALADISQDEIRKIQSRWVGGDNIEPDINLSRSEQIWLKNHSTINIAFDGNYPPYSFMDEQGEFHGIAVDIAQKLAARIGIQLNIFPNGNWQYLYSAAQEGNVDVIATLVKRPGREDWFEFTRPYISLSQYFVTRTPEVNQFDTKEKLAGKVVALIKGYSTSDIFMEEVPKAVPYYVDSLQEALIAVSSNHADLTIADIGMANHLISKFGLSNLAFSGLYTNVGSKQRMGVRKDWPQLATILDKALESIEYNELLEIYSYWNVPPNVKPEAGFISVMEELTEEEKGFLTQHPVIRLASDFAWPPFETISEKGVYSGIAADYLAILEKRLGVKFVVSPRKPWSEILDMLRRKELDLLSCAMETESRRQFANFTSPYISHPMVIVTRDDMGYVDGLEGLKGRKVAIEQSYASFDLLSTEHPELNLQPYSDSLSAMLAVSKGEAFAYIGNIATLSNVVRQSGITNIKISGQIPYQFELALGVRNDWPLLVPILQKALDSISLEDKNKVLQKWIAVKVEKPFDIKLIVEIVGIALFLLAAVLYWNFTLNRKVNHRTAYIRYQAEYDSLTDLPNRLLALNSLSDLIELAKEQRHNIGVLFLDIDDFKKINDTLGHEIGDKLIVEVSRRLKASMRQTDMVSRLGGDEFIILLRELHDPSESIPIIRKVINCFNDSFALEGRDLILTVSIGIAIYPDHGSSPSELLRNADTAMYSAKRDGRNTFSFFTKEMSDRVSRQLLLEEFMHGALERGEFEIYFQPKVSVREKSIIGFEALLRWNNPQLGSISPFEFIPVAENNGLIIPIGRFVLENSLKILKEWQQRFDDNLSLAVNLSPRQFRDPELVNFIETTLKSHQVNHERLELEITEGVLLSGQQHIKESIRKIKSLGVKLAMDDFGTGYSSLSYLRSYPFDTLKIDREFIRDITQDKSDRELAIAAISMAHSLKLVVVAEGVETQEQLSLLASQRCDIAQGYLFSCPLPSSEMETLIENWKGKSENITLSNSP